MGSWFFKCTYPHKELGEDLAQKGHKVIECNYQPTCENMLYEIAEKLKINCLLTFNWRI